MIIPVRYGIVIVINELHNKSDVKSMQAKKIGNESISFKFFNKYIGPFVYWYFEGKCDFLRF